MKRILLIGTGGTIASMVTSHGLVPEMSTNELLKLVPELNEFCNVECTQIFNLDSSNMRPKHWLEIAKVIQSNYDEFDGFVIAHGTDTMAYTASALSYLIQNSSKPIVLTGAQVPLSMESSDAKRNLIDAFICACDDESNGVQIVFFGSVIMGTRARKNFSKRFSAFGSINFPEIARISNNKLTRYVPQIINGDVKFYNNLNTNVGLIKLVPGFEDDVLRYLLDKYDGIVIEGFGVGGVPEYNDFYEIIIEAINKGKIIVMTTQVSNEGSDFSIYHMGKMLLNNSRIIDGHDMTVEAAFTKLMWVLSITKNFDEASNLFYQKIYNDICL